MPIVIGTLRTCIYWAVFLLVTFGTFRALSLYWPEMSFDQLRASMEVAPTPFAVFRDKNFALALSGLLGASAFGFGVSNLAAALFVLMSLDWNRRTISKSTDEAAFARNIESIRTTIRKSRLVSHAFEQFAKTIYLEKSDPPVALSTARPQAFINSASIREQSTALQLMSGIPAYFVGVGLLLTFIGLIAALSVAAPSVKAGNADQAKDALNQLLDAATFKFATSIAGLGGSLFLSVWFKVLTLSVERGIRHFCEVIEDRMRFITSQEISREIAQTMSSQLKHLTNLDSDSFFDRFGKFITPEIRRALIDAVEPLTAKFTQTTRDMTGEDFSKRLTDAVESMTRRLGEAADKLNGVVLSFEEAGKKARQELTSAAQGAGGSMGSAIESMIGSMRTAIQELSGGINGLTTKMTTQFEVTENTVRTLRDAAQESSSKALLDIEGKLTEFNSEATKRIQVLIASLAAQVGALSNALETATRALGQHEINTRESAKNVKDTADAFGIVARDVRNVTRPLTDSSSKVADSAIIISKAVSDAVIGLSNGQTAAQTLATELKDQADRIKSFWVNYEARFANVDEQMANAMKIFADRLTAQQALLLDYAKQIDAGFTKAVGNLNGAISSLGEQAEGVRDAMEQFSRSVDARAGLGRNINGP